MKFYFELEKLFNNPTDYKDDVDEIIDVKGDISSFRLHWMYGVILKSLKCMSEKFNHRTDTISRFYYTITFNNDIITIWIDKDSYTIGEYKLVVINLKNYSITAIPFQEERDDEHLLKMHFYRKTFYTYAVNLLQVILDVESILYKGKII